MMSDGEVWEGEVRDSVEPREILESTPGFSGRIWSVRRDRVQVGDQQVERDILLHLGAVAVVALDELDRVLLIRQYRHPVGMSLFETPAGLLDVPGEDPWHTAQRELVEEAGYVARTWHVLVDLMNSPGGSSEAIRVYLARDLEQLPEGRAHTGEAEEHFLPRAWVPLDQARDLVLDGTLQNPTTVCGVLAACAHREQNWRRLRSADAPWQARAALLDMGRVHVAGGGSQAPGIF
ncbi:MAG: NUDIX hydrolase [Actinomycetales bacterium]|nr:NUDIX hydrolase [Actinomycetales bacterium]